MRISDWSSDVCSSDFYAPFYDLRHVLHYLARLKQFGRIAIVTDQSWVRIASSIESALLPYVSYEVYPVAQRDRALAWVKGECDTPHPQAVHRISGDDEDRKRTRLNYSH